MTVYQTGRDGRREAEVARILEEHWNCKITSFGDKNAIDMYGTRDGELVSLLEIKGREYTMAATEKWGSTLYLSYRKWTALLLGGLGMGVRTFYVWALQDGIGYVRIGPVAQWEITLGGRTDRGAKNDIEPLVNVPLDDIKWLPERDSWITSNTAPNSETTRMPAPKTTHAFPAVSRCTRGADTHAPPATTSPSEEISGQREHSDDTAKAGQGRK
jgi:hypothetical protein